MHIRPEPENRPSIEASTSGSPKSENAFHSEESSSSFAKPKAKIREKISLPASSLPSEIETKDVNEFWSQNVLERSKNPTIISLNAFKVSSDTKDVAPLHIFAPPSLEKSARHPAQQLFVGEVVKRKVSVRDNVPQSRLEQLGMDVTEEDESAESRIIIAGTQARGRDEFEGVFRLKLKFTVVAMVNICLSTAFFAVYEEPPSAGKLVSSAMFRLVARDDPNLVVLYVALASLNAIGLVAVWCSHALLLAAYRFLVIANFIATTSHIRFSFLLHGTDLMRGCITWLEISRKEFPWRVS